MEQRREIRFKPNQTANFKVLGLTPGPVMEATVLDVSGSGMRLRTKVPIPCGAGIEIETGHLVSHGTVYRCEEHDLAYEIGIHLSETAPAPQS